MVDGQPAFEEYLSGVFVAIGLTFVIFLCVSTTYPDINPDSLSIFSLFVLSFLPPRLSGAVASFLVLRKARSKNVVNGVKVGLWTSVVGLLVGALLGNLRGGLWMVLGYIVGSVIGGLLIRYLLTERNLLGETASE